MDSYKNNCYGCDDIEEDGFPGTILFDELLANPPRLPEEMLEVFQECLMELGYTIQNNRLMLEDTFIGTLTLKDRIVLNMSRTNVNQHLNQVEKIRSLFAHRAEVAQKDYIYQREQQINQSKHNLDSYNKLVHQLEKEKQVMQNALKRQKRIL